MREFENALEDLGDFRSDGRAVEESLNTFGEEGHVVVETLLDVSFGVGVGECDETNFTGLGVDGGVGTLVETLADVQEMIEGVDVGPCTTLAASGVGGGVGFDVEEVLGEIDFRAEDFNHLADEFDVTFLGELTHEDAEGGLVADGEAAGALVSEGDGVTAAALPRNLTLVAIVGAREDGFNGGKDRNEGGVFDVLSEGCVGGDVILTKIVLLLVMLILVVVIVRTLFRSRARANALSRLSDLEGFLGNLVVLVLFSLDGRSEGSEKGGLGLSVGKSLGHVLFERGKKKSVNLGKKKIVELG